jgi:hypothetical protein
MAPERGTLAYLWSKASAVRLMVMPGSTENVAMLKVIDDRRPVDLTQGDYWQAFANRVGEREWEVGVWKFQLDNNALFTDFKDQVAVTQFKTALASVPLETPKDDSGNYIWTDIAQVLGKIKPASHAPQP